MRCVNPIFCKAARINQTASRSHLAQCKTQIDTRLSRWFDLSEDVIPVQRNDSLAGTCLGFFTDFQTQLQ